MTVTPLFRRLTLILALSFATLSASAVIPIDKYSVNRKDLPEAAREMLDKHFPKTKVSMIKVDRHLLKRTDYDVKLTNGTKIEFSNKGQWTHVECKKKSVPESLVPKSIIDIVSISRSSLYYTVGLSNGKQLKYDKIGIFQGELTPKEAEAFEAEALAEADSTAAVAEP